QNLDIEMHIQGVSGRSVYLSGPLYHAFQNNSKISSIALNHWTVENAESATYPRLSADDNMNNYRYSSFWQQNGDFIKIRSVEVGYTFSNKLLNRVGIASTRLFVNGTNLLSFDHLDHSDPELLPGSSSYPSVRTLSLGINVVL